MSANTIAVLIIGDEILTAQVRETNLAVILEAFTHAGYTVAEARIVRDVPEQIAAAFRELSDTYEYVVSAGGIGPTHDDVTLEAAAAAFGAEVAVHPGMNVFLEQIYGERMNDAVSRMSRLPVGADVSIRDDIHWPIIRFRNCFILPGLPLALKEKIECILELIPRRDALWVARLYLDIGESPIAAKLTDLQERHRTVAVGSYPVLGDADYKTRVTFRGADRGAVDVAMADAITALEPTGVIVRVDPPEQL